MNTTLFYRPPGLLTVWNWDFWSYDDNDDDSVDNDNHDDNNNDSYDNDEDHNNNADNNKNNEKENFRNIFYSLRKWL